MLNSEIKKVLADAAVLGRTVGVARNEFYTPDGSMCINGLIGTVMRDGEPMRNCVEYDATVNTPDFIQIMEVIAPLVGVEIIEGRQLWGQVASWNNNVAKDGEVIEILEKAAASIDAENVG